MANGKKTDQERINAAERRQKVLDLRKAGASFRAIGSQLTISEAQAHRDYKAAMAHLAELEVSSADELRTLSLSRLSALLLTTWRQAQTGNLKAIGMALRIDESIRKLLGLDAAPKVPLNPDGSPAQYAELRTVVLNLLAPFPDIRLALADQLAQLPEDVTDGDQPDN